MRTKLTDFSSSFDGAIFTDILHQSIYATDASVYRKLPAAVAFPDSVKGIKQLIRFANENAIGLVPRAGGTSLAGQVVGDGIIVDISKTFTKILDFDPIKMTAKVEPGVIRDELNRFLKPHNLFFAPNTSTSNRCTIGGMVGNNSSGTTSIKYGITRDKVVSVKAILSNGEEIVFEPLKKEDFYKKTQLESLEGEIYKKINSILSLEENRKEIEREFPKKEIHRRNTGYALDSLVDTSVFSDSKNDINLSALISGSEGTLVFITEITLQLDPLPPDFTAVIAPHYHSINECLKDVVIAMQHDLYACEMMDDVILDCTKNNKIYNEYRSFVKGNPKSILLLELKSNNKKDLEQQVVKLQESLSLSGYSYHAPVLFGEEITKAFELRKAGLGLLGNMIGDKKAVACIEDTAVALEDLPNYIEDFSQLMKKFNQEVVYYAHAGAGELHLRPILNLKDKADVIDFRNITKSVAELCKKYKASFSGEHGDGIVRGEFVPFMIGNKNYDFLKSIKSTFDPNTIFNPGKIINPLKMDESLRYEPGRVEPEIETLMRFDDYRGIHRMAENCNGSGDCRKTEHASGIMCPSYHATRNEKDTTRARANVLREVLTNNTAKNKFDSKELKEVLDLCLSCKACSSECPSNVDMATAKTEFLYQYYKTNKPSFSTRLFAKSSRLYKKASRFPKVSNMVFSNRFLSYIVKKIGGIHPKRSLPKMSIKTFDKILYKSEYNGINKYNLDKAKFKKLYLFVDEFSNYLDSQIAWDAFELLVKLGYSVVPISNLDSARTMISKGFLDGAKKEIDKNISVLKDLISKETPLIGIEPSAILSFRDEYIRLATDEKAARNISENTFLIEEFLAAEMKFGIIQKEWFTQEHKKIKIQVHCHQKSLSNSKHTFDMLNFPKNYTPTLIPSGCCGMAGSFGMEKEHYDVSMQIGELLLFPSVRKTPKDVLIASNGTSCRHQIWDGTNRKTVHPVTILKEALL